MLAEAGADRATIKRSLGGNFTLPSTELLFSYDLKNMTCRQAISMTMIKRPHFMLIIVIILMIIIITITVIIKMNINAHWVLIACDKCGR